MAIHPPLNALRAFEVVARTGAFTAAGAELGVTSAAVSLQVRNLEAHWGKKLFIRQGNRLALSEAGIAAYPAAARAMNTLAELSQSMSETRKKQSLVLSAPHSVVETWLPAKLAGLRSGNDESNTDSLRLQIRIDDDPVDFAGGGVHMRIFYGHGLYREYCVKTLFHDHLVAVASPAFIALHGTSVDHIADRHLIHTAWGPNYGTSPNWSDHLRSNRTVDVAAGLRVTASSSAVAFCKAGLGIALVPSMMARKELDDGDLVLLDRPTMRMPHPYSLAFPNALQTRTDVSQVLNALTETVTG